MTLHLAEIATEIALGSCRAAGPSGRLAHVEPAHCAAQHDEYAATAQCRELNQSKNLWQFMRDNWLSNRVFTTYEDIVDHCCEAWN